MVSSNTTSPGFGLATLACRSHRIGSEGGNSRPALREPAPGRRTQGVPPDRRRLMTYCIVPQIRYTKVRLRYLGGLGSRPHTHAFALRFNWRVATLLAWSIS